MTQQENKALAINDVDVLKNTGVQVYVWKTQVVEEENPATNKIETKARRTNEKRLMELRFTSETMADIETLYGTTDKWWSELESKPHSAVLKTFEVLTRQSRSWCSEIIITEAIEEYQVALMMAWMHAMGAPAEKLGKLLAPAMELGRAKDHLMDVMMDRADMALTAVQAQAEQEMEEFLGDDGSNSGSSSTKTLKTSGESVPDSSTSSSTPTENDKSANSKRKVKDKAAPDKEAVRQKVTSTL